MRINKFIFSLCISTVTLVCVLFFLPRYTLASQQVVQIGDSLTVGMYRNGLVDKFKAAGWDAIVPGNNPTGTGSCDGFIAGYPCHGVAGGESPTGIQAVDINKDAISKANAIVIEMGTNRLEADDTTAFKAAMSQMIDNIRAINKNAKIYWVNLVVKHDHPDAASYSTRNKSISEIATEKQITIIDWFHQVYPNGDPTNVQGASGGNEDWFAPGGIPYNNTGYAAFVSLVVSSVNSGGNTSTNTGAASGVVTATACFMTKVGNPLSPTPPLPPECNTTNSSAQPSLIDASDCPIPGGFISCGSMFTPITTGGYAACGHCGPTYPADSYADNCTLDWAVGTQHAIDVAKAPGVPVAGEPVYLPKVNGHIIQWTNLPEEAKGSQSIQKYAGEDTITHDKYYLQLHHTAPGSSTPGTNPSGTQGARIWSGGDHVHVQIGSGSTLDPSSWLDAAKYFCGGGGGGGITNK